MHPHLVRFVEKLGACTRLGFVLTRLLLHAYPLSIMAVNADQLSWKRNTYLHTLCFLNSCFRTHALNAKSNIY